MDKLFKQLDDTRSQYAEGLIDKTDTLAQMAKFINNEVLNNSVELRNMTIGTKADQKDLEKIRLIVARKSEPF